MTTLTVTIDLQKMLGLEDIAGVQFDICETVDGNVDVILTGSEIQVKAVAKRLSEIN